jgi:hypothetical protein
MLTTLFAACLLMQQQVQPQSQPRRMESNTVTVQGRDFSIPHIPATEEQAKEYDAVFKKINSTMDTLENELALLYRKYEGKDALGDFAVPKEKATLPEAAFFESVLRDEKLGSNFDELLRQRNKWIEGIQLTFEAYLKSNDPQLILSMNNDLYASDFAKAWESFQKYLNGRIKEFTEMEANPLIYQDSDIKRLYDMASIRFMEQLRLSLWLCQNVWYYQMSSRWRWRESDVPKPLSRLATAVQATTKNPGSYYILNDLEARHAWDRKRMKLQKSYMSELYSKLAPYKTVQAESTENPGSHIALSKVREKDLDRLVQTAKSIYRKDDRRLIMTRMAQPKYVPNEGEFVQAWKTTVRVQVAMDGSVSNAEYMTGPEHLRELSLQAAKLLMFYPLRKSDFNEPQSTNITFNFD